jgi:phage terminase small subunit
MDIEFNYNHGSGHMILHAELFFPTSKKNLKKLLSLTTEQTVTEILDCLDELEKIELNWISSLKKLFPTENQKMEELGHRVKDKTFANGVRMTTKELKEVKADYQEQKSYVNKIVRGHKDSLKRLEGIRMNRDYINEHL